MSLAADGQDENELQLEKSGLNFSSYFCASSKRSISDGRGLFSLCELWFVSVLLLFRDYNVHILSCLPPIL